MLRLLLIAIYCAIALPIASIAKISPPRHAAGVEVHFTGKHAFAKLAAEAGKDDWAHMPMGETMGHVAAFLMGTPYVSYTLDHSADREYCIVNLQELDCVTFVESALALSRVIKENDPTGHELARQIQLIRYRDGKCSGFCSRLHYLTDWFYDNDRKGLVSVYTSSLPGAEKYDKKVSLMSDRPQLYKQLRAHPGWVPQIRACEKAINSRTEYYLPKAKIAADESFMETGDIVAITTSADILDCAHTGLIYKDEKGVAHLLHASEVHKEVYLDEDLATYMAKHRYFTGIMLARPLEPKA